MLSFEFSGTLSAGMSVEIFLKNEKNFNFFYPEAQKSGTLCSEMVALFAPKWVAPFAPKRVALFAPK